MVGRSVGSSKAAGMLMRIRSAARKLRDHSADTVRRLQLRGGLSRLDRILRAGKQPGALLLRQLWTIMRWQQRHR